MLVFNLFSFSFWSTTGCFSTSVNFNFWRRSRMKCIFEIAGTLNAVFFVQKRQGKGCQGKRGAKKKCHRKEMSRKRGLSRESSVKKKQGVRKRDVNGKSCLEEKRCVTDVSRERDARTRKFQQLSRLEQLAALEQLQCCKGTEGALEALDCFGSTGPQLICTALLRSSKLNQWNRICLAAVIAAVRGTCWETEVLRRGC